MENLEVGDTRLLGNKDLISPKLSQRIRMLESYQERAFNVKDYVNSDGTVKGM